MVVCERGGRKEERENVNTYIYNNSLTEIVIVRNRLKLGNFLFL